MSTSAGSTKTYYQTLELDPKDATPTTIKKAYRRLALKYHPDKNRDPSAPDLFRAVSEAYEVLHDPDQKKEYDRLLKYGHDANFQSKWEHEFAQFNDLFQNDPFFQNAAEGLDELFSNTFRDSGTEDAAGVVAGVGGHMEQQEARRGRRGLGAWIMDKLGIEVSMSTTSIDRNGGVSSTSYRRSGESEAGSRSSSTYTRRSTKTVVENGKRMTVQSMEKDGNRIEERYEGSKLVGRTINGVKEQVGRIGL